MRRRRGLTLLELVLVLVILAAVAGSAATVLESQDLQLRHDETRTRAVALRGAIVGHDDRSLNGQPDVSGFVADIGRLPEQLSELVARGAIDPAAWRGPYLRPESLVLSATNDPLDGYGNAYQYLGDASARTIRSFGSDGPSGTGTGPYEQDLDLAIAATDWSISLDGTLLPVTVRNTGTTNFTGTVTVNVTWPVFTTTGTTTPVTVGATSGSFSVAAGGEMQVTVTFPATGTRVPVGTRTVAFSFADGTGAAVAGEFANRPVLVRARGPLPLLTAYVKP